MGSPGYITRLGAYNGQDHNYTKVELKVAQINPYEKSTGRRYPLIKLFKCRLFQMLTTKDFRICCPTGAAVIVNVKCAGAPCCRRPIDCSCLQLRVAHVENRRFLRSAVPL